LIIFSSETVKKIGYLNPARQRLPFLILKMIYSREQSGEEKRGCLPGRTNKNPALAEH